MAKRIRCGTIVGMTSESLRVVRDRFSDDICPQRGFSVGAEQAMAFGTNSDKGSQVTRCVDHPAIQRRRSGPGRRSYGVGGFVRPMRV